MPLPAAQVGTWESHHLGQNRGGGTQQLLALEPRLLDSGQKHRSLACHPFNSVPSSNLRSRKYLWNPSYQKNLTNIVSSCFISAVQEGWIKSRLEEMLNELIYYNCHTPPCPLSAPPPVHAANTSRCLSFEAQLKGHLHFSFLIPCRPSSMSHLYQGASISLIELQRVPNNTVTRREEPWCHPRNAKLLGVPKIKLRWGQFPLHWLHNHPAIHIIQKKWLDSL